MEVEEKKLKMGKAWALFKKGIAKPNMEGSNKFLAKNGILPTTKQLERIFELSEGLIFLYHQL